MLGALTAFSASPAIFIALAVVAALLALGVHHALTARRRGTPTVAGARSAALRSRARRSVYVRLRDPDAAGRPRPRAPSTASAS